MKNRTWLVSVIKKVNNCFYTQFQKCTQLHPSRTILPVSLNAMCHISYFSFNSSSGCISLLPYIGCQWKLILQALFFFSNWGKINYFASKSILHAYLLVLPVGIAIKIFISAQFSKKYKYITLGHMPYRFYCSLHRWGFLYVLKCTCM